MTKKHSIISALLGCGFVYVAATRDTYIIVAIALAVACFVCAVIAWRNSGKAQPANRQAAQAPAAAPAPDTQKPAAQSAPRISTVYVAKNGSVYHSNTLCQHIYGRERVSMTREQAQKQGIKPCKSCYPYGDTAPQRVCTTPQPPAEAPRPAYSYIHFNVAGVTHDNEDGTSRQELIQKIEDGEPPFVDADALNVRLIPTKYGSDDAIECRVNGYMIGYVPKDTVPEVMAAFQSGDVTISGFKVVGGNYGNNYGVKIAVRYTA